MLRLVSAVSGVYDLVVGAVLLLGTNWMAATFGVAPPEPVIFARLNAIFLICIGIGYYLPWRDPVRYRAYLWIMGPLLKGAGALAFLIDYFVNGSPKSFLLFAASDGILALWTLGALMLTGQKGRGQRAKADIGKREEGIGRGKRQEALRDRQAQDPAGRPDTAQHAAARESIP